MNNEIFRLKDLLDNARDEINELRRLEELHVISQENSKEKDQLNELLQLLLDGIGSPKLAQIMSELKYLNSELRRARNLQSRNYIDSDDLNILERKISLLRDEMQLVLNKINSGAMKIPLSPLAKRRDFELSEMVQSQFEPDPKASQMSMPTRRSGLSGGVAHQPKQQNLFSAGIKVTSSTSGLGLMSGGGHAGGYGGGRGSTGLGGGAGSTSALGAAPGEHSGISGYAHLRDKLSLMQSFKNY